MSAATTLERLRLNRDFMAQAAAWERKPARPARWGAWPSLDERLRQGLAQLGVEALFSHQTAAIEQALAGQPVVVATGTASGKTLCYSAPVLQRLLDKPGSRALYLFPTKALAQDQLAAQRTLIEAAGLSLETHIYDGDTPQTLRRAARLGSGIVISNPDMLHAGILPYHTQWRALFSRLEFVVLDEIHAYRGIFGSHVANVLRRLQRVCEFYGSRPNFICCSATIANPREHAERLTGVAPFTLIDESQNGAPQGEKHVILYNPPLIDEDLGLRQSLFLAAMDAATAFLEEDTPTVVFARSRQGVELLLGYVRDELIARGLATQAAAVAGYRGGYLPLERRAIEAGLRDGSLRGVVATNALELGVDIGSLEAAVLAGYPGTVAATWQQAGRVGRRDGVSAALLVAGNSPLDQYLCRHPGYLFGRSPEHALINPDNPHLVASHVACAAYEIPFAQGEPWGGLGPVDELLDALRAAGQLHATGKRYYWIGQGAPQHTFSLRTAGSEQVIIQTTGAEAAQVIAALDRASAPRLAHEGAIYTHQGETFLIERLDWETGLATARPVEVDYYTRARVNSVVRQLTATQTAPAGEIEHAHGMVQVTTQATGFRQIRRYTAETLGYGTIDLPPLELETTGYWLILGEPLTERLFEAGILLRPNAYGPDWAEQRQRALERDGWRCRTCGLDGRATNTPLHVHHVRPFREYGYRPGENDRYRLANQLDNLVTLCPSCHRQAETAVQQRSALAGLAYVLGNLAPLFLMCDPTDIEVSADSRHPLTRLPTIIIYEQTPAGVGLAGRLFEVRHDLLAAALELVRDCPCRDGCPACVGPPGEVGPETKAVTRQLLVILKDTTRDAEARTAV